MQEMKGLSEPLLMNKKMLCHSIEYHKTLDSVDWSQFVNDTGIGLLWKGDPLAKNKDWKGLVDHVYIVLTNMLKNSGTFQENYGSEHMMGKQILRNLPI